MPLEFAPRPRFRLSESPAPARRSRPRLPRVVLPIVGYWLGMAALTHAVIVVGKSEGKEPAPSFDDGYDQRGSTWLQPSPEPAPSPAVPLDTAAPEPMAPPDEEPVAWRLEEPLAAPPQEPAARAEAPIASRAEAPIASRVREPQVRSDPPRALAVRAEPAREPAIIEREPPAAPAPEPPPPPVASTLPSCEAVVASSSQDIDMRARDNAPDLPREAFSRVLDHGGYLSGCGVPERTALDICVAVQEGKVRGVSVTARPANAAVAACVKNAVGRLRFPYSRRLDVARTRFEAAR